MDSRGDFIFATGNRRPVLELQAELESVDSLKITIHAQIYGDLSLTSIDAMLDQGEAGWAGTTDVVSFSVRIAPSLFPDAQRIRMNPGFGSMQENIWYERDGGKNGFSLEIGHYLGLSDDYRLFMRGRSVMAYSPETGTRVVTDLDRRSVMWKFPENSDGCECK